MEVVPPGSPVPLEVRLPSLRGHHDPSFASSSKVAGDFLALFPTSYDLLFILFAVLQNPEIRIST